MTQPIPLIRRAVPRFRADDLVDPRIEPKLLFSAFPPELPIAIVAATPGSIESDVYVAMNSRTGVAAAQ